jgi:hypothetical protein
LLSAPPFLSLFSSHTPSPPQQPSPPQRRDWDRTEWAELGTEGLEALPAVLVFAVLLLASFSRMLGTFGLWALLPTAVQGKCVQKGQVFLPTQ